MEAAGGKDKENLDPAIGNIGSGDCEDRGSRKSLKNGIKVLGTKLEKARRKKISELRLGGAR